MDMNQSCDDNDVNIAVEPPVAISSKHYQWRAYHTFTIICLRLCGDLTVMVPLMFDDELSEESLTTLQIFSYVNIGRFVGTVLSIFWSPLNMKLFHNDNKTITIVYAILSAVFNIGFGCTYFMKQFSDSQHVKTAMITWQCIMWTLFGISFSIYNSGTIAIATQYSDPAKHGAIVSTISLSWSVASVFYLVAAYLIKLHAALPFIVFGALLLFFAVLIALTYNFEFVPDEDTNNDNEQEQAETALTNSVNMRHILDVMTDDSYSLILAISFIISIASGANITVLGSPLLHDLYGLNVSQVGWSLLVTFFGEFTSNLYMIKRVDKRFFRTASYGLALKIFAGMLIIFVSMSHDIDSWISLTITLCMMYVVFFAWEMVFVSQLTAMNDAVDTKERNRNIRDSHNSKKRLVFIIHLAVVATAKPIGIWIASTIWADGDGLIYVGFLLILTSLAAAGCYYMYWRKRSNRFSYQGVATTDLSSGSGLDTEVETDAD